MEASQNKTNCRTLDRNFSMEQHARSTLRSKSQCSPPRLTSSHATRRNRGRRRGSHKSSTPAAIAAPQDRDRRRIVRYQRPGSGAQVIASESPARSPRERPGFGFRVEMKVIGDGMKIGCSTADRTATGIHRIPGRSTIYRRTTRHVSDPARISGVCWLSCQELAMIRASSVSPSSMRMVVC